MSDIDQKLPMKAPKRIEDSTGVTVYQITSVIVPWISVGIDRSKPEHLQRLYKQQATILDWLDTKCRRYEIKRGGIWFLDADDAMKFKLTWAGMI